MAAWTTLPLITPLTTTGLRQALLDATLSNPNTFPSDTLKVQFVMVASMLAQDNAPLSLVFPIATPWEVKSSDTLSQSEERMVTTTNLTLKISTITKSATGTLGIDTVKSA